MKKGITVIIPGTSTGETMVLPLQGQINTGRFYPPNCFNYGGATLDPSDPANDDPNHAISFIQATVVNGLSIDTEDPGVGETTTATVMKNGVATSISAVLTAGNNFAADLAHSASFAPGDRLSVKIDLSGGSVSSIFNAMIKFI